jgi:hypothetical protein
MIKQPVSGVECGHLLALIGLRMFIPAVLIAGNRL